MLTIHRRWVFINKERLVLAVARQFAFDLRKLLLQN